MSSRVDTISLVKLSARHRIALHFVFQPNLEMVVSSSVHGTSQGAQDKQCGPRLSRCSPSMDRMHTVLHPGWGSATPKRVRLEEEKKGGREGRRHRDRVTTVLLRECQASIGGVRVRIGVPGRNTLPFMMHKCRKPRLRRSRTRPTSLPHQ